MEMFLWNFCYSDFVSDFDLMLEKKKEEAQRRRKKRKDVEILNDSDDFIAEMMKKMKEAAEVSLRSPGSHVSYNF